MSGQGDGSAAADQLLTWRFDAIRTIADIAPYWAGRAPRQIALIDGDRTRTYAELDLRSNQVANHLLADGVARGSNIGFIGKNAIEFWEMWFGASKAACALAPFNWRCAAEELVAIVGDARPAVVIVGAEFVGTMEEVRQRCSASFEMIAFGDGQAGFEDWIERSPATTPELAIESDDVALLSYTSGTTGLPKGVMATQQAFAWSFLCGAQEPAMAWRDGDVMLMTMPNFHLGGSWVSIAALYHGKTLSILPAFDPAACIAAFERDRVTIVALVPAAIQLLLDHPGAARHSFASLRSIMYFGSPISAITMARTLATIDCSLVQFYGTTESYFLTILRHDHHLSGDPARLASCGVPLPLVSIRVAGDDGENLPAGEIGEIHVRTPMMFAGYWSRPDATAEVLRDGWYQTGDLGRVDADGFLTIVDRAKDMIISGGENIYSTEVELALGKLPGIRMCAVVGLPDEKWGERVVAAIMAHPAAELSSDGVIAHCRGLIAGYKVPKQILFFDALPLTPTGKVRKAALREQLARQIAVK